MTSPSKTSLWSFNRALKYVSFILTKFSAPFCFVFDACFSSQTVLFKTSLHEILLTQNKPFE